MAEAKFTFGSCWPRDLCSDSQALALLPAGQLGSISTTAPSSWGEGTSPLCRLSSWFNALSPVQWAKRQLWTCHQYSRLTRKISRFNHLPLVAPRLGKTFPDIPGVTCTTAASFNHRPFYPHTKNNVPLEHVLQSRASPQPAEKLVGDNKVPNANKPFMTLFCGVWSQDEATVYQK